MPLDTPGVTNRANSELTTIDLISKDVSLDTPTRMALIKRAADNWERATAGSVGHFSAARKAKRSKWNWVFRA